MTTFARESVVCGACGQVFSHQALASTNTFGSPDLDTRPPEMQRSTMRAWIQRCPSCGFCAPDVTKYKEQFRPLMDGSAYRSQLTDARYPELASSFICAGLLADGAGSREYAGWAYLKAAWTLDDAGKDELARIWRSKAADLFRALVAKGQCSVQQPDGYEVIIADCLRRAGRGDEAVTQIERALSKAYAAEIQKVLNFQRTLIQRGDTSCHLMREPFDIG